LPIPPDFIERFSKQDADDLFLTPITEFTVGKVTAGKPAEKAGLLTGDQIMAIDSIPVQYYHEFRAEVGKHAGSSATLQVKRPTDKTNTNFENVNLMVDILKDSTMGFEALYKMQITEKSYTFLQAIPKGSGRAFSVVWVNIKAFGRMFQGHLSPTKSLRGPLGIMKTFGVTWDWVRFWTLTGLISMILAFMNLLPIPALDGGHVIFLLYEIVSRRKPSDKFLENAQKVGMVLLLALMVFVIFNDIFQEWIL